MSDHQLPLRLGDDVRLVGGMKVLFFIRDLAVGGSQRQLAVLAAGLARRGHDVAVAVLYAGGALEALLEGSSARCLSIGKSSRWHALAPLARPRRAFFLEASRSGLRLSPNPDHARDAAAAVAAQEQARVRAACGRRATRSI